MEDHPIDIQELIRRLNTGEHLHGSSHFSDSVSRGEPIIKTGRQLMRDRERAARRQQNHPDAPQPAPRPVSVFDQLDLDASVRTRRLDTSFPNRYREMRAISRWEQGAGRGRWLTEAELFYKQARFMEDFEDTCPYEGSFRSYYPTYNDMSNRQLRGYFTWRANVRRGEKLYISPYKENADLMFDSSLPDEVAVLKPFVVPLLEALPQGKYEIADDILRGFERIEIMEESNIAPSSLVREFIGGSIYPS